MGLNRETGDNPVRTRRCDPARTIRRPVAPIRSLVRSNKCSELTAGRSYLPADAPAATARHEDFLPRSLADALDALESDHQFLLRGDVFTQDVIDTWIEYKTEKEVNDIRLRPHPQEFFLYYDI